MPDVINIKSSYLEKMTEDEFFLFCQENKDLDIERNAKREIFIMSPTGLNYSHINAVINRYLGNWSEADGTGKDFESSAGFHLPDHSILSPDASWVKNEKWDQLAPDQKTKFAPICPDFVVELRSPSDPQKYVDLKMGCWMNNGVQLAWMIDPDKEEVEIYRSDGGIDKISCFSHTLSGEEVLPGFELPLEKLRLER